jgi:hypothetical protein
MSEGSNDMYQALDSFLEEESWTSHHWSDEGRFFRALDKIVRNPEFKPVEMGDYLERAYRRQFGEKADPDQIENLKNSYIATAETVRLFLMATGG